MSQIIRAWASPTARVENSLVLVRWVLWLLAIAAAWLVSLPASIPVLFWIWAAIVGIFNLGVSILLRLFRHPSSHLPVITFVSDIVFFGLLPHLVDSKNNLLEYFLIYPALVGAIRFGPQVGLVVAGLLILGLEVGSLVPFFGNTPVGGLAAALPIAALLAATGIVGYLVQHEKEAAIKQAASELDDLRRAMAGAKLLYATTHNLSTTTSYAPVLEAMLEAGVKGLPPGRREDGPPVAIALFFDERDKDKRLRVIASRHLDRRDPEQIVEGKAGIVGQALKTGNSVVFDNVSKDPELSAFSALNRCRGGVCYPLQAGLEQYGVVVLAGASPRRPSPQHMELMRAFTNQAALSFQNAKLYENLRLEHDQTIRSDNEMRAKLARDLHDGPTQKVAALVMQLDYINRLLDRDIGAARVEIDKAREVAQQTVKEIRTSLFALRPLALETKGLSAALTQLCERLHDVENVPIQVEAGEFGPDLDPNISGTVFAIIEEAVNNARKHGNGAPIFVHVARQNDTLVAYIQDQGPGFDLDKVVSSYEERSSLGLQNMRDRARLIDADLRIDSDPGRGTRITLIVPLRQPTGIDLKPQSPESKP
ncbi:MAG TPA: histidine kinase [Anaerolineae bacterium]